VSTQARSGATNRAVRAIADRKAKAGSPCWRCGGAIDTADRKSYHAGHVVDKALGGTDDATNIEPEHVACNLSAGGKLAQALKAAEKVQDTRYRPAFWFPARGGR